MVGLSVAAILLAVVLVVGLLAWVGRDLRARRAPMRAWWVVVGCYVLAAVVWLVAITVPLPVTIAWLATIPAAVATVIPERVAAWLSAIGRAPLPRRRSRARSIGPSHPLHDMAHPIGTRTGTPAGGASKGRLAVGLIRRRTTAFPTRTPASAASPSPPATVSHRTLTLGRHRWHAGDLRLAVELLEDAMRIPDLDDAARERIEARLARLDRFRDPGTTELLTLVRDDVHARLASDVPGIEPDPARTRRIGELLDELDPRPSGTER
jgi:hypothetical protein